MSSLTGQVVWHRNGMGFSTAENGEDFFVHHSEFAAGVRRLFPGDQIEFTASKDDQGRNRAKEVKVVTRAPRPPRKPKTQRNNKTDKAGANNESEKVVAEKQANVPDVNNTGNTVSGKSKPAKRSKGPKKDTVPASGTTAGANKKKATRQKISKMSAEVVDSNPYRSGLSFILT
jgi:cold shock CspA family protein